MYGWIVDGISSLFEPISVTQPKPTDRPGNVTPEIPTPVAATAESQRRQEESSARPVKRNYQSVHASDNVSQSEPLETKRRRKDVVLSFVKKTVAGVAGLLGLRKPLSPIISEKRRPCTGTQTSPVSLMGIDELQTSWMSSSDWRMEKQTAGGMNERETGGPNHLQSSSTPLPRNHTGSVLCGGKEKTQRRSLQLLPPWPTLGMGMGTGPPNPDLPGPVPNRSYRPCLAVEEARKESDREHYRRLVEMVAEKYSKNQPLPFTRTKPQGGSLPQDGHKAAILGRTCETVTRETLPKRANPSVFMWRDASSTKQVKDRRGEVVLSKPLSGAVDPQPASDATKQTEEVDLSAEVAARLNLVDRESTIPTQTNTHITHTRHSDEDFPRLSKEMVAEVSRALGQRDPNLVLSSAFKLRITQRDLATLQEGSWLNDEVINFYLSLLMAHSAGQEGGLRVYSFSTFFFPKLHGRGGGQEEGHTAVRRWTKAVDLFLYDLILVPLHLGVHWSLAVIDFKSRTVRSYDSMGQRHDDVCNLLLLYLREEHKARKARELDISKWTIGSMRASEIPQQKNGSDCGVFACKYADYIAQRRPLTFRQCHMPLFRKLMIWEILNQRLL